jgi:hypothetical protein
VTVLGFQGFTGGRLVVYVSVLGFKDFFKGFTGGRLVVYVTVPTPQ